MKLVFIIHAHEGEMPDMKLMDACTLELFAKSEKEAVSRAKKLVKKKFYRISQIIEKD